MKMILVGLLFLSVAAKAAVPVSVSSFKNKVGQTSCDYNWGWWSLNLDSAFQDMLITELSKNSSLDILERENIEAINNEEVELVNSSRSHHKIRKGGFEKARYTIIGAVTGYEYCAEKKKASIGVSAVAGFLGLGGAAGLVAEQISEIAVSKATAKVIIDVRVVDTETGRIVKTIKSEGTAERSNFNINSDLASYEAASETPVGEASRQAVEKAVAGIIPALTSKVAKR